MPFHLHKNGEKAQASVPDYDFTFAAQGDLRIDERPRISSRQLQKNDSQERANLRSRNRSSVTRCFFPVCQGISEVLNERFNFWRRGIRHGPRNFAQYRVTELSQRLDGHALPHPCQELFIAVPAKHHRSATRGEIRGAIRLHCLVVTRGGSGGMTLRVKLCQLVVMDVMGGRCRGGWPGT